MIPKRVNDHKRCKIMDDPNRPFLQWLDERASIGHEHKFIRIFHMKTAAFRPNGDTGTYGGDQPRFNRAGRFRTPGDGRVDVYTEFGVAIEARRAGRRLPEGLLRHPTVVDGAAGVAFVGAALLSASDGETWVACGLPDPT